MDLNILKEMLIPSREIVLNLGGTLANIFPFPASNIAAILVLAFSFFIVNSIFNTFFEKDGLLIKLFGTGALYWLLWVW